MRSLGPGWCLLGAAVALTPLVSFGQTGPPKTSWGDPDLRGVWDFRTITPMERPDALAGKEFLSDEEAAAFREQALHDAPVARRTHGRRGPSDIRYAG